MKKPGNEVRDVETIIIKEAQGMGIEEDVLAAALRKSIEMQQKDIRKVLILPPDFTRSHSQAGKITAIYYNMLKDFCQVDIMPALGTHLPMTSNEIRAMYGDSIPEDCFIVHDWRNDIIKIGEVPGDFVREVSGGLLDYAIDVEVNKRLMDPGYDLILSVGQVVPHEVVGMANYGKNIFVGCGGKNMINKTHFLGAVYGMERIMGRDHSPVRKVFDYAEEHFLKGIPLVYVLTVIGQYQGRHTLNGLFIGRERRVFEEAVALSQEKNLDFLDEPLDKVVVYLDPEEFKSTWVGNKAVYRTRMAIADGGELIVLAPGVKQFGEDEEIGKLIRKYGYTGRENILKQVHNTDLQQNLSAAAHLIHGSSDGRFTITYAVEQLPVEEVEKVGFHGLPYREVCKRYNPKQLKDGWNIMQDGEKVYYISNPALGLWAYRERFMQNTR